MNKHEFLRALEKELRGLPREESRDILYDYEEHFSLGAADGKTEAEIAEALGSPVALGRKYRAQSLVEAAERDQTAGSVFRAVLATLGLGIFNLIFVLGPFIGLLAVLFALFAVSGAVILVGVATFFAVTPLPMIWGHVSLPAFVLEHPAASLPLSVGLTALGSLMVIVSGYITLGVFRLTLKYLRFNIDIITRR